jgi:N5-(cytidine 5'-diphosphoramidyl)-L-glutamine hydrolase
MMAKNKIGISLRVVKASNYDENRDALSHDWAQFLEKLNLVPILIPNQIGNVSEFLDMIEIDGLILSGGDNIGDFPQRDSIEKSIIDYGIKKKLPIIGVCRGMQMINEHFGGSTITTSDQNHVNKSHTVDIMNSSKQKILESKSIIVNSFHNNLIKSNILGQDLEPFALSSDKSIEGFFHKFLPLIGVMWHPERSQDNINQTIFKKAFQDTTFWNQ